MSECGNGILLCMAFSSPGQGEGSRFIPFVSASYPDYIFTWVSTLLPFRRTFSAGAELLEEAAAYSFARICLSCLDFATYYCTILLISTRNRVNLKTKFSQMF